MDYKVRILPEHRLVIEWISGEVTLEEMIQKTKQLFSDPLYQPDYSGIVDLRGAASRMSKVELYGFAQLINDSEQFGHSPWAILGDDPMVVALSQIFQQRLNNPEMIGVFSTVACAADFVQKPAVLDYLKD